MTVIAFQEIGSAMESWTVPEETMNMIHVLVTDSNAIMGNVFQEAGNVMMWKIVVEVKMNKIVQ
jgi:hypothetical protein